MFSWNVRKQLNKAAVQTSTLSLSEERFHRSDGLKKKQTPDQTCARVKKCRQHLCFSGFASLSSGQEAQTKASDVFSPLIDQRAEGTNQQPGRLEIS